MIIPGTGRNVPTRINKITQRVTKRRFSIMSRISLLIFTVLSLIYIYLLLLS
jgi:hypothetical protein